MLETKGKRSKQHRVLVSFTPLEYFLIDAATPYLKESIGRTSLGYLCNRASVALAKQTLKSVGILDKVLDSFKASTFISEPSDDYEEPEETEEDDVLDEVLGNE